MSNPADQSFVVALDDPTATLAVVGGKGASLARLAAARLPVPTGFHVTTAAYQRFVTEHGLQAPILAAVANVQTDQPATLEAASEAIRTVFAQAALPEAIVASIHQAYQALQADTSTPELAVAVRSSATAEDLPELSFAGQQESYLNLQGEAMVLDAIKRCWASLWTARAIGYRAQHGIDAADVQLAVVVQTLVPADAAGILFTANPLTGARDQLVINAAWGLGEAIVGGQVTPDALVVDRTSGTLIEQTINAKTVMTVRTATGTEEAPVPEPLREQPVLTPAQVAELSELGRKIEALYGQPMDIEWARHDGRFFILQARPITRLAVPTAQPLPAALPPDAEVWNDSLQGDYLWTNANVGEAVPDVMTPCTWSLVEIFIRDTMAVSMVGGHRMIGNIGGRFYMNLSLFATLSGSFGMGQQRFAEAIEQVFGRLPAGLTIPLMSVSRWRILRDVLPTAIRMRRRIAVNQKKLPAFLETAPARATELRQRIAATDNRLALRDLWSAEVLPFFSLCSHMLEAGARQNGSTIVWTRRTLNKLVGEVDTNALLSRLSDSSSQLASLGLLSGLDQLAHGQIDPATFAQHYGHRGPHEFEVSLPRPAEDPEWVERQLAGLRATPTDLSALLARQEAAQTAAWARFQERYPRQVKRMQQQIARAVAAFRAREAARSEVIRAFWVLRAFVQRAGILTGQGEDIFFLTIDEILALLGGDEQALAHIPARRKAYDAYRALPPYPTLIRGHFDPFRWAANRQRRSDFFAENDTATPTSDAVKGFPGASGVVEGQVRVIANPDQGDQLQPGEILVTTVTNVGWTPLFPRAGAVVTDVGAPLSHAAIVARELGIPAVVGCGNATMRLHTGDWVRVNGELGVVELLRAAAPDELSRM